MQTGEDLTNDPQLKDRGFIVAVENPRLGKVVLPNFPLHFANAQLTRRWEFPVLGRDTEAVLRDVVGYSAETSQTNSRMMECWSRGELPTEIGKKSLARRRKDVKWEKGISLRAWCLGAINFVEVFLLKI